MKKILALLLMLFVTLSCSQNQNRGVIIPKVDSLQYSEDFCCIFAPKDGFSVYDSPNGNILGKVKRIANAQSDNEAPYKIYFVSKGIKKPISSDYYEEIGYEIHAFKFTEMKNDFVKILEDDKNYWLKISEIEKQGFKAVSWMDFLLQKKDVLGYFAKDNGLMLREEPNVNGKIIGSVRGDLFEITLTNEISGQWSKVKITKYKEHPCETGFDDNENIEYQSEGWMKIIDDKGEPNIWYYTRGC